MVREWLVGLWDWLRRDRMDRELQEELEFHARELERDARAAGQSAAEARRTARRKLGRPLTVRESARRVWSWPWLDQIQLSIRYAIRGLKRAPGFALTATLTLGLGIGANAAMFSIIDQLMFRPFPYLRDPGAVNRVYLRYDYRGREILNAGGFEYTRYEDLKRWTSTFSEMAAFAPRGLAVGTGIQARERPVFAVSAAFFDFFDAKPVLGRFFGPSEDQTPRGASVVVLSYAFWKNEMGGGDVIGETLRIRELTCDIIGVAPEGFVGVAEGEPPVAFIPITTYAAAQSTSNADPDEPLSDYYTQYHWGWLAIMARRKVGVTEAQASADLTQAYVQSWNAESAMSRVPPVEVARPLGIAGPLKEAAGPGAGLESKTLLWVAGVAGIVLLIACANVANLMLARVLRRRRETAVRLALGVSRTRLIVQGVTESLLLGILGCVAGVLIAQWGGAAIRHLFVNAGGAPVIGDWRTLRLAGIVALLAGLMTGIGPALLAGRGNLVENLKSGVREGTVHRSRTRVGLLVFQGALSVILLVGAGLFVRSLQNVRAMRLGYDEDAVLMVVSNLRGAQLTDDEEGALALRLLDAAVAMPSVDHAAAVTSVPFWSTSSTGLYVAGIDSVQKLGRFTYQTTTPDYFATMGTHILRGRGLTPQDREGAPRVAVVSEAMATALWPGRDALGQCMHVGDEKADCTTVVGIAENAVQSSLTDDQRLRYYLPITQYGDRRASTLLLRIRGNADTELETVRRVMQPLMPGDGYVTVRRLSDTADRQRRSWLFGATMFGAFGILALLVAAVGLYGVVAYSVTQRMHELGVRTALGATGTDLVRLVVGQGIRFAMAGIIVGSAVALLLARWIQPLLFQQSAKDPGVYVSVAATLLVVAVAASAFPALRATQADPNAALRGE